jgi:hypothetical protein
VAHSDTPFIEHLLINTGKTGLRILRLPARLSDGLHHFHSDDTACQGFTAFTDLAELITVVIGVEDGTLWRVGLGQPVLGVGVLQPLAGGQFNGREAAVAVVLLSN